MVHKTDIRVGNGDLWRREDEVFASHTLLLFKHLRLEEVAVAASEKMLGKSLRKPKAIVK